MPACACEVIEQDMVAVPLTGPQRQVAVAAPAYLAAHGAPGHPRDLVRHRCIGWRPAPQVAPYRWEFSEDGREFEVDVGAQVTTNDLRLMLRTVLPNCWAPIIVLYFPSRRHQPPKLRALVDYVRAFREPA